MTPLAKTIRAIEREPATQEQREALKMLKRLDRLMIEMGRITARQVAIAAEAEAMADRLRRLGVAAKMLATGLQ